MSSRTPPRYLPTLTEVVDPQSVLAAVRVESQAASTGSEQPAQLPVDPSAVAPESVADMAYPPAASGSPDRNALAQQLIQLVRPQLEAELRHVAQELFEAQFSALLPSMHLHIEEAVRDALEQALPQRRDELGN